MIDVYDYAYSLEESGKKLPTIAFLVVDGTISGGKSLSNPLQGESIVGSETLIQQLDEIANNKYVKALLLRINSPGGSYTASAEIWNALSRLKEKRKLPIVVSMGDYAASGGYFIALPGDKILAEASTVTGSIGVLGGKMVLAGCGISLRLTGAKSSLETMPAFYRQIINSASGKKRFSIGRWIMFIAILPQKLPRQGIFRLRKWTSWRGAGYGPVFRRLKTVWPMKSAE